MTSSSIRDLIKPRERLALPGVFDGISARIAADRRSNQDAYLNRLR